MTTRPLTFSPVSASILLSPMYSRSLLLSNHILLGPWSPLATTFWWMSAGVSRMTLPLRESATNINPLTATLDGTLSLSGHCPAPCRTTWAAVLSRLWYTLDVLHPGHCRDIRRTCRGLVRPHAKDWLRTNQCRSVSADPHSMWIHKVGVLSGKWWGWSWLL